MTGSYLHSKCGKRVKNSAYHCAGCHESFVGEAAFVRHRKGGVCAVEPVSVDPYSEGGFWLDEDGYWHSGRRLTADAARAIFSAPRDASTRAPRSDDQVAAGPSPQVAP